MLLLHRSATDIWPHEIVAELREREEPIWRAEEMSPRPTRVLLTLIAGVGKTQKGALAVSC